jgi:hypothetical protein
MSQWRLNNEGDDKGNKHGWDPQPTMGLVSVATAGDMVRLDMGDTRERSWASAPWSRITRCWSGLL